jgi:hypothetical protein
VKHCEANQVTDCGGVALGICYLEPATLRGFGFLVKLTFGEEEETL